MYKLISGSRFTLTAIVILDFYQTTVIAMRRTQSSKDLWTSRRPSLAATGSLSFGRQGPQNPTGASSFDRMPGPALSTLTPSASFQSRNYRPWEMSTTAGSTPSAFTGRESPPPTFMDQVSDHQLAFLMQNRGSDPCNRIFGDKKNPPDKESHDWKEGDRACTLSYLGYKGIIDRNHNKSLCPHAQLPRCRLIQRGNPKRREWTCTVLVHNPLLIGCFTLRPYRVEHLDYCVSTLRPSLTLRSKSYDRIKHLGRNLSSSEGGTTPKPVYTRDDIENLDDFEDDIL